MVNFQIYTYGKFQGLWVTLKVCIVHKYGIYMESVVHLVNTD